MYIIIPWRRAWQLIPVFLPRESHGQRILASYSPQGCKELDMTEMTEHTHTYIKKDLNDPDNDDGVISHLEPGILECEVKWALGSITTNIASGGNGIPAELFQILKGDAVKVLHSTCQQIWKTQQGLQDWKMSIFILIPEKGNAKECSNYHTIALISRASEVMLKNYPS